MSALIDSSICCEAAFVALLAGAVALFLAQGAP